MRTGKMEETQKALFKEMLVHPESIGEAHTELLRDMARAYPASNIVHAFLAKSLASQPAQANGSLNRAAVYSADRQALFILMHQAESIRRRTIPVNNMEYPEVQPPVQEDHAAPALIAADVASGPQEILEGENSPTGEQDVISDTGNSSGQEEHAAEAPAEESGQQILNSENSPPEREELSTEDPEANDPVPASEPVQEDVPVADTSTAEEETGSEQSAEPPATGEHLAEEETQQILDSENGTAQQVVAGEEEYTDDDNGQTVEENTSGDLSEHPFTPPQPDAETGDAMAEVPPTEDPENAIDDVIFDEIAEAPVEVQQNDAVPPTEDPENAIDDVVFDEIAEAPTEVQQNDAVPPTEDPDNAIDDMIFDEIAEAPIEVQQKDVVPPTEDPENAIDDVIFDEIAEAPETIPAESFPEPGNTPAPETKPVPAPEIQDPERELYDALPEGDPSAKNEGENGTIAKDRQPSRYHDEKMPYSFMWWLDKTRREHADTYQPYAAPVSPETDRLEQPATRQLAPAGPLEQQYIEHIFHVRSVEELDAHTRTRTVPFSVEKKQDRIIEKFIREEPQISTPRPEKLDMENKARKSTEDKLEMVSETLAKIYTEQMLYDKALDTYQKLRLKYPEKSAYFAARIDELQYKIR
ncbi:MAG: hypothetical protein INR69_09610 [Mucilaginibacter polytrichastri]|nr:hypothetical protein [Mucilaginibacter polytrichastri]